jgi:hypothetical protein
MPEEKRSGGCQCGAVRYEVTGPPIRASVCYCGMCQRASGGPFMAFARYANENVRWSGALSLFQSSTFAERGFCGACGTPLTYRWIAGPNISLTINSFDEPEVIRPELRYSPDTEVSWCRTLSELPVNDLDVSGASGFVSYQRE